MVRCYSTSGDYTAQDLARVESLEALVAVQELIPGSCSRAWTSTQAGQPGQHQSVRRHIQEAAPAPACADQQCGRQLHVRQAHR